VSRPCVWDRLLSTAIDLTQGRPPRLCILNLWIDQRIARFQFNSVFAIRENSTVTFPYVSIWGIHPWLDSSTVELSLGGLTSGRTCRLLYLGRNLSYFGPPTLTILTCSLSARLYKCRAQLVGSQSSRSSRLSWNYNPPDPQHWKYNPPDP
jgi:hypothetical protein